MKQSYCPRRVNRTKDLQTRVQDEEEKRQREVFPTWHHFWKETSTIRTKKRSFKDSSYFKEPFWKVGCGSRVQFV